MCVPVLHKQQSPALSRHQRTPETFWSVQSEGRRQSWDHRPRSVHRKTRLSSSCILYLFCRHELVIVLPTTKVLGSPRVCVCDRSKRPGSTAPSSPKHSPQRSLASGDESWQPLSSTDTRLEMTGSTASLAHTCRSSHSCSPSPIYRQRAKKEKEKGTFIQ